MFDLGAVRHADVCARDVRSCAHTSACLAAVKPHRCGASEQKVRSQRGNFLAAVGCNVSWLGGFAAQKMFDLGAVRHADVCARDVRSCAHTSACLAAVKPHRCGASEQKVRSQLGNILAVVGGNVSTQPESVGVCVGAREAAQTLGAQRRCVHTAPGHPRKRRHTRALRGETCPCT